MLQCSPGWDIRAALHQAHYALFDASSEVVTRHVENGTSFYLPCAEGLLICSALRAGDPHWHALRVRPSEDVDRQQYGSPGPDPDNRSADRDPESAHGHDDA
jgi:hypothetical protein